tara:strand:- start:258 stop:665 length:408 start_codon:yes stop_codon:yes gene_type:complete
MSDNNASDNQDVQQKITHDFKKKVLKWLEIDDQIREMRAKSKELNTQKKQYEEFILSFLEQVGEKELAVSDGKLRRNVSKTKKPLSKDTIQKALTELVKEKEKVNTMTEHIINSRPVVERINLKRTKNRGPKNNN